VISFQSRYEDAECLTVGCHADNKLNAIGKLARGFPFGMLCDINRGVFFASTGFPQVLNR
jgi:hypothetical protein